jgi:hypothetical protein
MLPHAASYYAGMFLSFMQKSFNYNLSTFGKQLTLVAFNVVLTATNLVGIGVAGSASVVFLVVVLSPVAILVLVAMPHMSLGVLLATTPKLNFFEWVNIIVWNTNRCIHRALWLHRGRGVLDVRVPELVVKLVVNLVVKIVVKLAEKLVIHTTQMGGVLDVRVPELVVKLVVNLVVKLVVKLAEKLVIHTTQRQRRARRARRRASREASSKSSGKASNTHCTER